MVVFFTHDEFDALMQASIDSRGAVMVLLMRAGHPGTVAGALADAIIGRQ